MFPISSTRVKQHTFVNEIVYKIVIVHGKFLTFISSLHQILLQRIQRISGECLLISFSWAVLEEIGVMDSG